MKRMWADFREPNKVSLIVENPGPNFVEPAESPFVIRLVPAEPKRICLVCGRWWDAQKYPRGSEPCGRGDEAYTPCTLDMTDHEAAMHWKQVSHNMRQHLRNALDSLDRMGAYSGDDLMRQQAMRQELEAALNKFRA